MQSEMANCMSNYDLIPPMMFVSLPPPPPPFPGPPGPLVAAAPPPPPPPPIQRMPFAQPPPPPPPPLTAPLTSASQGPSPYRAPPPILPPLFDASRPPPPLPGQCRNGKRKLDAIEAGPSKLRKREEPKADCDCEHCVQFDIRIELFKQQLEKLQCEEECQRLLYKMKHDEFERGKSILKSLVTPEMYSVLEEYIEDEPPQPPDIVTQLQSTLFSGSTSIPKQFLIPFMEYLFENQKKQIDTTPSLRLQDTINQALSIPRRTNLTRSSSDILASIFELLNNGAERSQLLESRIETQITSSTSSNGFSKGTNECTSTPGPSGRYANVSNTTVRSYTNVAVPAHSTNTTPVPYPLYHPGIPPPLNRPYLSQMGAPNAELMGSYVAGGNMAMVPGSRPPAPAAPPAAPRVSATAGPSGMPHNTTYPPYMMARFPHPPNFYPPYQ